MIYQYKFYVPWYAFQCAKLKKIFKTRSKVMKMRCFLLPNGQVAPGFLKKFVNDFLM